MKLPLVILLFLASMLYFWTQVPKYTDKPPTNANSTRWHAGRSIYKTRCVTCHNANPDLPGSVGPKLRGVSLELLADRLKNGKGGMPAQKKLVRVAINLWEYLK